MRAVALHEPGDRSGLAVLGIPRASRGSKDEEQNMAEATGIRKMLFLGGAVPNPELMVMHPKPEDVNLNSMSRKSLLIRALRKWQNPSTPNPKLET